MGGTTSAWSGKHAEARTFSYQQIHAKTHFLEGKPRF
ncbi:hypothetical protein ES703_37959 [subsurface metagenome]